MTDQVNQKKFYLVLSLNDYYHIDPPRKGNKVKYKLRTEEHIFVYTKKDIIYSLDMSSHKFNNKIVIAKKNIGDNSNEDNILCLFINHPKFKYKWLTIEQVEEEMKNYKLLTSMYEIKIIKVKRLDKI